MTAQEDALAELVALFDAARVRYMLIGGLANIVWGQPRATIDIDVTVWIADPEIPAFVDRTQNVFRVLVEKPLAFIAETRVLPMATASGIRIDVIFGLLPFEREAIERAREVQLAGTRVRVCTPEDLVLMKIVSDRERDIGDAREIVRLRLAELDRNYLEPRINELSELLVRPDIRARWKEWTTNS
jgi:predicted nucleotidyltransferase